jgi:hypothetical protein
MQSLGDKSPPTDLLDVAVGGGLFARNSDAARPGFWCRHPDGPLPERPTIRLTLSRRHVHLLLPDVHLLGILHDNARHPPQVP